MKKHWFKKPKKIISLLQFIKTGNFGGAVLGMTDEEVKASLGMPEDVHYGDEAILFRYGWWEIHFMRTNGNKAFLIYNDHLLYDCTNHDELIEFENKELKLELDFLKPKQHYRFGQALSYLDNQEIDYQLVDREFQPMVQLDNHVYMDFTDTEPTIPRGTQFAWGPGRGQDLQQGEKRLENTEDWILYNIGAYQPPPIRT